MKKYKLTDETIEYNGRTLYRIEALKDFGFTKAGSKGGWVQSEANLSHLGECWIDGEAKAYGESRVHDDAQLWDNSEVFGNAHVFGNAIVIENAQVCGDIKTLGVSDIYGYSIVGGCGRIYGALEIGCPDITDITINSQVYGDAIIKSKSDYIEFKNHWSNGKYFIYTKSNKMWSVDYFNGTGENLIKRAYEESELNGQMYEKYVMFVEWLESESWISKLKKFIKRWKGNTN